MSSNKWMKATDRGMEIDEYCQAAASRSWKTWPMQRGDSHYLQEQWTPSWLFLQSTPVKGSHAGHDSVKQREFCIPGGHEYNPGSNKTRADRVGPVNVICKVLIRTWRLCEAGSQLSRQRRPDLLPKQHSSSRGDRPWKRDFLSVGVPVWMGCFKQIKSQSDAVFAWPPSSSGVRVGVGVAGRGTARAPALFAVIHVEGRGFVCLPHASAPRKCHSMEMLLRVHCMPQSQETPRLWSCMD